MKTIIRENLTYLPQPNKSVTEISNNLSEPDVDLVTASFMLISDDYGFYLANNQRRGIEISGGHLEKGETSKEAAFREGYEETGIITKDVELIAIQTLNVEAEKPENYKYPYPTSYMTYYKGKVQFIEHYIENDECAYPVYYLFNEETKIMIKEWLESEKNKFLGELILEIYKEEFERK